MAGCDRHFHELDFEDSLNGFSKSHFEIYKLQFQVTDNLKDSKIQEIITKYEGQIEFIEP